MDGRKYQRISKYRINSNKTVASTDNFSGGINTASSENNLFDNQVRELTNFEINPGGGLSKRAGTKLITDLVKIENTDIPSSGPYDVSSFATLEKTEGNSNEAASFFLVNGIINDNFGKHYSYYKYKENNDITDVVGESRGSYIKEDPSIINYELLVGKSGNFQIENDRLYWKVGGRILIWPIVGGWLVNDTGEVVLDNLSGLPLKVPKDGEKLWIELPVSVISSVDIDNKGVNVLSESPYQRVQNWIIPKFDGIKYGLWSENLNDWLSNYTPNKTLKEEVKLIYKRGISRIYMESKEGFDGAYFDSSKIQEHKYHGPNLNLSFRSSFYSTNLDTYLGTNDFSSVGHITSLFSNDELDTYENEGYWGEKIKQDPSIFIGPGSYTSAGHSCYLNMLDIPFTTRLKSLNYVNVSVNKEQMKKWSGWDYGKTSPQDMDLPIHIKGVLKRTWFDWKDIKYENIPINETFNLEKLKDLIVTEYNNEPNWFDDVGENPFTNLTFLFYRGCLRTTGWFDGAPYDSFKIKPLEVTYYSPEHSGGETRSTSYTTYYKSDYFYFKQEGWKLNDKANPGMKFIKKSYELDFKKGNIDDITINSIEITRTAFNKGTLNEKYEIIFDGIANDFNSFEEFINAPNPTNFENDIVELVVENWPGSINQNSIPLKELKKGLSQIITAIKRHRDPDDDFKITIFNNVGYTLEIKNKQELIQSSFEDIEKDTIQADIGINFHGTLTSSEGSADVVLNTVPNLLAIINPKEIFITEKSTFSLSISALNKALITDSERYYSWNVIAVNRLDSKVGSDNFKEESNFWKSGEDNLTYDYLFYNTEPFAVFGFTSLVKPNEKDQDTTAYLYQNKVKDAMKEDGITPDIGGSDYSNKQVWDWSFQEVKKIVIPVIKRTEIDDDSVFIGTSDSEGSSLSTFDFMIYKGQMILYNDDKVFISDPYNYGYFPKSFIRILSSEGGSANRKIQALKYFQDVLVIFTNEDIHALTGDSGSSQAKKPINIKKINNNYGAIVKDSIININNKIAFISAQGIYGLLTKTTSIDDSWNLKRLDDNIKDLYNYNNFPDSKSVLYKDYYITCLNNVETITNDDGTIKKISHWLIYEDGVGRSNWSVWKSEYFDVSEIWVENGSLYFSRKNAPEILRVGYLFKDNDFQEDESISPDTIIETPGYRDRYEEGQGTGVPIISTIQSKLYSNNKELHKKRFKYFQIMTDGLGKPTKFNINVLVDGLSEITTDKLELILDDKGSLVWTKLGSSTSVGVVTGTSIPNKTFYYNFSEFLQGVKNLKHNFKTNGKGLTAQLYLEHKEDRPLQISGFGNIFKYKKAN